MINSFENPFSVTKASEFTDQEIFDYWINLEAGEQLFSQLNPSEYMPKYIIGGKGSGKTHLLRYYSFQIQTIRNKDISTILENEGYIGLYSTLSGLNSSRFKEKSISNDEWSAIFEYYFELYICDIQLNIIKKIVTDFQIRQDIEENLVQSILEVFFNFQDLKNINTIELLIKYLNELKRKIDSQINNAAYTRKLDVKEIFTLFSPGDLLFGIPQKASEFIEKMKEIKFIYIFDEYEKLFEWQKNYINTLVWDKKTPVTFWIGARRYGYTTRLTKSGQEMKTGSEFQLVDLDSFFRRDEVIYEKFATKLYANRLQKYYEANNIFLKEREVIKKFSDQFERYDESKILDDIKKTNLNKEFKHLRELRVNLQKNPSISKRTLKIESEVQIERIIKSLKEYTENNPLEQKYKLFLFYKLWYENRVSGIDYNEILSIIDIEFNKFKGKKKSLFDEILDKRKKDLLAQLTKENNLKNTEFSGIGDFIKISNGNVRSFILILKKVLEYSKIKGEKPLHEGSKISIESQYMAVYDTAEWFYNDVELTGEKAKNFYTSLKRLTDYFIIERFSDKPVDTTVSCFYVKSEHLSVEAIEAIETMKTHLALIEIDEGRSEKNTGRKERLFQINKILAPLWNLPVSVRGTLPMSLEVAEAIFNPKSKFEKLFNSRKLQLNAPDFANVNGNKKKKYTNPKQVNIKFNK